MCNLISSSNDFKQNSVWLIYFSVSPHYKIVWKSVQYEPIRSIRRGRRTNKMKMGCFAKAPRKYKIMPEKDETMFKSRKLRDKM